MGDTCFLGFLGNLGLGLGDCRHERDERVPDRLLHRVVGGAIEGHPVYDGFDADAAPDELPDCIGHVRVIAPQAVNPANDQHIPRPENIEQATTFGAFA